MLRLYRQLPSCWHRNRRCSWLHHHCTLACLKVCCGTGTFQTTKRHARSMPQLVPLLLGIRRGLQGEREGGNFVINRDGSRIEVTLQDRGKKGCLSGVYVSIPNL